MVLSEKSQLSRMFSNNEQLKERWHFKLHTEDYKLYGYCGNDADG